MTLTRTQKVKQRTQQVLDDFIKQNGREPTVSELREKYQELLERLRKAPRGKYKSPTGWAYLKLNDPERFAELARKGGLVKKK